MKIVFLQQLWYEWQAPMIFSAIAKKKGHDTFMYIKASPRKAAKKAILAGADMVIFASITSGNMKYVYECAAQIKKRKNVPIIVGGVHISLFYDEISMQNIDFLGIGEGEYMFSLLLDAIKNGTSFKSIPGLGYKSQNKLVVNPSRSVRNLDEIPTMDRMLYYKYLLLRGEKVRMFYSGRGCCYDCSYCCVPLLAKLDTSIPLMRKKSPEAMISEIQDVQEKFGLKAAFFQDDTFTQDRKWLLYFLKLYKEHINKPLMCMSRAINIDKEIANALADSGCVSVGIGVETAHEKTREKYNRMESNTHISRAITLLKNQGIRVTTFNILGIPEETLENIRETITFNSQNRTDSSWGILYQPYVKNRMKNCNIESSGNFYSQLGYNRPEKAEIELMQKLYPILVRWPQLEKILIRLTPKIVAHFFFEIYSFLREIFIWRRSFVLTLIMGLKNQFCYRTMK